MSRTPGTDGPLKWCSLPDAYQQLTALVHTGPLRQRGRAARIRLGRTYDTAPRPGVLEVCLRVEIGNRHHMVAFRLEQRPQTTLWKCTAVETH
ncbi:Rv3235 family protein [Kitasatospora sp. GP82]|uniref:Rv3235 family protein n=1 Tax=Kitasatospora sp. GP82 TaxID=3035089 RepID=UPI0024745F29|nr:Rv3235 family protein [Kitasatospora sp. GP82]